MPNDANMIPKYKRKSLVLSIPGFAILVGCTALAHLSSSTYLLTGLPAWANYIWQGPVIGCFVWMPEVLAPNGLDRPLNTHQEWIATTWLIGSPVAAVLFLMGLCYYAKAKGYSGRVGLLGLLSSLGLLILAALPDKTKNQNNGTANNISH